MSVRTMARVWEFSQHDGSALLMLLALADFADDDGNAFPSVPTLAKKCRTTPRHANRLLCALRDSGELDIRLGKGPRGTNRYRVVVGLTAASPLTAVSPRPSGPEPLTSASSPPDLQVPKPLTPRSDEPSLTHQITVIEPSGERTRACAARADAPAHASIRKHQLDIEALPPAWRDWCAQHCPDVDAQVAFDTMRAWAISNGKRKADWEATFQNWCRRDAKSARGKNPFIFKASAIEQHNARVVQDVIAKMKGQS